jgi:hypothetical protein
VIFHSYVSLPEGISKHYLSELGVMVRMESLVAGLNTHLPHFCRASSSFVQRRHLHGFWKGRCVDIATQINTVHQII